MPIRQRTLIVALLATFYASAGLTPTRAAEQDGDALAVLIAQGKYWQNHRRGDLAEQAWEKVLRIDPKQPDALYGMGVVEADRKQPSQAEEYLVQLRDVAPNDPRIDDLARRLGESTPRSSAVDEARRLAQQGQPQAAAQRYQEALAKGPVSPELALEYYQSLGSTQQGWNEARRGLDALAKAHPDEPRYALALAQHLTYREATRREGIEQLQKLASVPDVSAAARTSWRQGLLWLGGRAADEPLYQAFLQANPDDAAVKARYDALAAQEQSARAQAALGAATSARGRAISEGFDAAEQGDLTTAEARFQSVLKSAPNDGDALGGMGVVRLKQEKFGDAKGYLERASQAGNPGRWRDALKSATYWSLVSEAIGARSNGEPAQAKTLFEKAIAADPSEVTAQNLLGDTLMSSGDARAAEAAYRMVLRRQADNPDAIRGLVGALAAQGRGQEALQFANQLSAEQQEKVGGISKLKAQAEQADARAAETRGDLGTARSLLEDALLNDPDNPWMRLDLGRIYVKQGANGNAKSLMDGLLAAHPDMPDVLYAAALLAGETRDWNNGLALLQRIAPAQRARDMTSLQHRLWVNAQAEQASTLAGRGQAPAARAMLAAAEPVAAGDVGLMGTVANAYAQIGDTNHALALMRGALAQTPQQDPGLLLQYAGVLLATQQEVELVSVLQHLQAMSLTPAQRQDLSNLNLAVLLRRADALRVKGDLAAAFDTIAPALAARPDDPELQSALGRMYASAGEPQQALQCFQRALSVRPDDLNTLMSAIGAGTAAHDWSSANALFDNALRIAPGNPRVLATGGRLYHAQGKNRLAADYFRRSLIAENAPVDGVNGPLDMRLVSRGWDATLSGGTQPVLNPFIGRQAVDAAPDGGSPAASGQAAAAGAYGYAGGQAAMSPAYQTAPQPVQTMPYIPPPAPPAPYVMPAPTSPYPYGPRSDSALPSPGYGPDANGASDAGGADMSSAASASGGAPAYQAYPNQPAAYSQAPAGIEAQAQAQASQAYPAQAQNAGVSSVPGVRQPYAAQPYPQQGYAPQPAAAAGYVPAPGYSVPQTTLAYPVGAAPAAPIYAPGYPPGYGPGYQPAYQPAPGPWPAQPAPAYYSPYPASSAATSTKTAKSSKNKHPANAVANQVRPTQGYAQPGYPPPGYPQQGYVQPGYPGPYSQQPYGAPGSQTAYAAPGYAPSAYPQSGVPQGAYAGYPQAAYANAPQQAYAPPTYPQGYAAPGYPQQAYAPAGQPAYAPPAPGYAQTPPAQPYVATNSSAAAALASALPGKDNTGTVAMIGAPPPMQAMSVQDELDQINREQTSTVGAGMSLRNREGTEGLSTLTDIETPVEGQLRAGDGHIIVRATPVFLDAGTPDLSPSTQSQFGTGLAVPSSVAPGSQHATGTGLSIGYQNSRVAVNVGSTPLGFRETNVIGDINYHGAVNDTVSYQLAASRQPVTDSLLSYAGTVDPRSGRTWGGVVSSGGRAQLGWDDGTSGLYVYGSYNYLSGDNVESNTRAEGGGGFYTHVINGVDESLTAGVNAMVLAYDKNLSGFTLGQGGYFSPQNYIALNLPVDYYGRSGNLVYRVNGSLGVQHFRENQEDYFPSDANLQNAATTAGAAQTPAVTASLPGQSKTGVRYNLTGVLEYQLAPQVFVGGVGGVDNATDYRQWYASVYMRYAFTRTSGAPLIPPSPLVTPYPQN